MDFLITPRDPKRIPRILKLIEEVWKQYPDYRLGQLLINLEPAYDTGAWFVEDDVLETELLATLGRKKEVVHEDE